MRLTPFLNLPAPGRCHSLYVPSMGLAERCVFVKQSVGPFHCGSPKRAPFIPKLQGQFAEFLNHGSLEHLSIFNPSTCVGLRYGLPVSSHEAFLASMIRHHSVRRISPYCRFSAQNADLPTSLNAYGLQRTSNRARVVHFWVPP